MDNRNRDKMSSESTSSTSAGNVNRNVSQDRGNVKSDSDASFGQKIGRSENLENEPSRRSGSQSSSSGSMGSSSSSGSSSSKGGWQSSGGRKSNLGEQSNIDSSSSSSGSMKERGDRH